MSLKKVTFTTNYSSELNFTGQVRLIIMDKLGHVQDYYAVNDLTKIGMKSIFENLVGLTHKSFSHISVGLMPNIDNCDQWPDVEVLEDLGVEIKITSNRLRNTELYEYIDGDYNVVSFTVNFAIKSNEGNGEKFNCMGLYMNDGKLFALVRFAEITKIEDINIIVQWKLIFKSKRLPISALKIIAQNMVAEEKAIDSVEIYNNGVLIGSGDIAMTMTEPERTNIVPMSDPPIATDTYYLVSDLRLEAIIDDPTITEVDRIVIKSGEEIFDDVSTEGWRFGNIPEEVRNAFVYKIKLWEVLKCKDMLLL